MAQDAALEARAGETLARLLHAARDLPPQGWATVRWEKDGTVSALLKVGCRAWRARSEPAEG